MGLFAFVCLSYEGFGALGGLTCEFAEVFDEIIFVGLAGMGRMGFRVGGDGPGDVK
jgi:hypothetical protein